MLKLVVGYTEPTFSKPKICNSFLKPNLELGPSVTVVVAVFNIGRHLVRAQHYRDLRMSTFAEWSGAVA
jgi:hypothetical protein